MIRAIALILALALPTAAFSADCQGLLRDLKRLERQAKTLNTQGSTAQVCRRLRSLEASSESVARRIDRDGRACGLRARDASTIRNFIPGRKLARMCPA